MSQNIRKYAMKHGLITCLCTNVICAILFFFMIKTETDLHSVFIDLTLTVGCTGFICALLQVFLTKKPVKEGVVPPVGDLDIQASYIFLSKSIIAFLVYFTIIEIALFSLAPYGIIVFSGISSVPRLQFIILKTLMAGFAAGMSTYHANIFVCGVYQEKIVVESESK